MSREKDIVVAVGEQLETAGVGVWGSSFAVNDVALVFGSLPQGPVKAVGLTPYSVSNDDQGNYIIGLQMSIRAGDLGAALDIRQAIFEFLDHRASFDAGGHHIIVAWRQSSANLGLDGQFSRLADNYYLRTDLPVKS